MTYIIAELPVFLKLAALYSHGLILVRAPGSLRMA